MMAGYAGKILRLNLAKKTASVIDSEPYEERGAGNRCCREIGMLIWPDDLRL
jgi:hypothetical protein